MSARPRLAAIVVPVTLVALGPGRAIAQWRRCAPRAPSRSADVRVAAMTTRADIFALDRALGAAGLPAVAHGVAMAEGETEVRYARVVATADAGVVLRRHVSNASGDVATGGTIAAIGIGFAVGCGARWTVYPMAGIGTTLLDLAVVRASGATVDSALTGRTAGSGLAARTWYDDFGIGASSVIGGAPAAGSSRFVVGARAGYVERFEGVRWRAAGRPIAGGPNYGLSGPYLMLSFGVRL